MTENTETMLLTWFEARYGIPVGQLMYFLESNEKGLLWVLPCKEGTTLYEIRNNTDACASCPAYDGYDPWCGKSKDHHLSSYPELATKPLCEKQFMEIVKITPDLNWIFEHRTEFGKTVFLDKEAAETVLYSMCRQPPCFSYGECQGKDNTIPCKHGLRGQEKC